MQDVPWQVCHTPRLKDHALISQPDFQRAFQGIADFVFAAMNVQLVPGSGFENRFEQIICAAGLLTGQLVPQNLFIPQTCPALLAGV